MKRLLCIVDYMDAGGAETFLMKIYRNIDRSEYQMDFITCVDKKGYYDEEILRMGGRIFHMPHVKTKPISSLWTLYKCIKNNKYDSVLLTTAWSLYSVLLIVAKMAGAKKCGIRSTNTKTGRGRIGEVIQKMFIPIANKVADVKIAPSIVAAEFMYGKDLDKVNVHILNNGINIEEFKYSKDKRDKKRKEFNATGMLFGHVGRMVVQKNHSFLLDVYSYLLKMYPNSKVILIGKGGLEDEIKKKIKKLGIDDSVLLLGVRNDVPELLMAMDAMVFPSFWEGLPNVVIEAQATGLPCLVSESVTNACAQTDCVDFCSLSSSPRLWAKEMRKMLENRHCNREAYSEYMRNAGYDICSVTECFINLLSSDV